MSKKSSSSSVTGYRYYFSVLVGICRGPVDEIFQIKSGGYTFFDGHQASISSGAGYHDPSPPPTAALTLTTYGTGTITDNAVVGLDKPTVFGGDSSEGGISGVMWVYMGAKDQVIAGTDYIKSVMSGLRLSDLRGVLTAFFDGEITANTPYPKAWTYRVRRVLKGWDGDVWYPERAVIKLTDPAIPSFVRGATDTSFTTTTVVYSDSGTDVLGASTGSGDVTEVISTYDGASVTTYHGGAITTSYAVPPYYNDIYAMNPAHIIYECCTNRDWGRGMPRALLDNVSFTDAANQLYDEQFGMCIKWSRTEDVDAFVQTIIDHIGAAVYTDRVTGLLCLRLMRNNYSRADLSTFDYNSGLLEVTSVDQAASDATANEVVIKYRSPVLDAQKEARAQNIALINQQGAVFNVTKDYSGLPTSTLASKAAQRELKIQSGGWKRVEFKLDRRAYRLVPSDVIILNAPDKGLDNIVIRVATVDDSVMTDGSITVVGSQDIYGWPVTPMVEIEPSIFLETDRSPHPIVYQNLSEATYRDAVKVAGRSLDADIASDAHKHDGFMTYVAARPTVSALNFVAQSEIESLGSLVFSPWEDDTTIAFSRLSVLNTAISTTDTVLAVSGGISSVNTPVGGALIICAGADTYFSEEIVRLDAISVVSGVTYLTVSRGCVDTPAIPHAAGSRVWAYDGTASVLLKFFTCGDTIGFRGLTRTSAGTLDPARAPILYGRISNPTWPRIASPYCGANFRVNGWPRDAIPTQTGDLVFTWTHRNRVLQNDTLVGELEAGVTPETGQNYALILVGTRDPAAPSTFALTIDSLTGTTYTVTAGAIAAAGWISGPMSVVFQTARTAPEYGGLNITAYRSPHLYFDYDATGGGPPVLATSGFGFDFGDVFSSGA